jgi:hypothetical protein
LKKNWKRTFIKWLFLRSELINLIKMHKMWRILKY